MDKHHDLLSLSSSSWDQVGLHNTLMLLKVEGLLGVAFVIII